MANRLLVAFFSAIVVVTWPVQREDSRGEFNKRIFNQVEESQAVTWAQGNNTLQQFPWRTHRKYIVNFALLLYWFSTLLFFFWRAKLVEYTQLVISPRSLRDFWNFLRYANFFSTAMHATMSIERGNDRQTVVHAPSRSYFHANQETPANMAEIDSVGRKFEEDLAPKGPKRKLLFPRKLRWEGMFSGNYRRVAQC